MLDLRKLTNNYYEITMLDGEVLHIRRPSQKILMQMIEIENSTDEDINKQIDVMYDVILQILNLNTDGKTYDREYIEKFDVQTLTIILQDYINFLNTELGE